jgi:O-antigen/teichoic acid export membrane protein
LKNLGNVRRWASLSSVSIVDQGLISGSNFLVSVLLARWLVPEEYGYYGIAYSIFLLLVWLHSALILEPLTVFGTSRYLDGIAAYFRVNLRLNTVLALALSVILIIGAVVANATGAALFHPLLALALSLPFIFLYWLYRRECYVLRRPSLALYGSLTYATVSLVGVILLRSAGLISAGTALILLGVASLLSSVVVGGLLLRGSTEERPSKVLGWHEVLGTHWFYGRWVIATGVVYWLVNLMYVPLVGLLLGADKAGLIKAFQNLFLPVEHILTALGLLVLPRLSISAARVSSKRVLRLAGFLSLGAALGATLYSLLVSSVAHLIVTRLYQQALYERYTSLAYLFGLVAVLAAARFGFANGLRAIQKPQAYFYSNAAGAVMSLTLGIFLVRRWDVVGAVFGQLLSTLVSVLVLVLFWRWYKSSRALEVEG